LLAHQKRKKQTTLPTWQFVFYTLAQDPDGQGTAQVYSRFTINHHILINFLVHLMHDKRVA
jgi:hypothetical protein